MTNLKKSYKKSVNNEDRIRDAHQIVESVAGFLESEDVDRNMMARMLYRACEILEDFEKEFRGQKGKRTDSIVLDREREPPGPRLKI